MNKLNDKDNIGSLEEKLEDADSNKKQVGKFSDEWKKQNSEFMKKRHAENGHPMLGKNHSEESKNKMSENRKGTKLSKEHKEALLKANKMPQEKEQAIIDAYASGEAITSISNRLNTSSTSIYRVIHRNGIVQRTLDNDGSFDLSIEECKLLNVPYDVCKIYLLTNTINNKVYIGQTWNNLDSRFGYNGEGYKNSTILYSAIQRHGANNFKYSILATAETQEDANKIEHQYIEQYDSKNQEKGYNIKDGGSVGKHSEETINKISETMKNKEWSPEALENKKTAGKAWKGKKRGPHTDEWKENNSIMMKEYHATHEHPMLGKHHTEEAKQKISEASKGPATEKHLAALRANAEKRKMDPTREAAIVQAYLDGRTIKDINEIFGTGNSSVYRILKRNNIDHKGPSKSWAGKTHTEETKAKMAVAREEYWRNQNVK